MPTKYLDSVGLEHLWSIIASRLGEKANVSDLISVAFNSTLTSGTKIGDITLNGVSKDIYAPTPTLGTSASADTNYFDNTEIENPYLKLIVNGINQGAVQLVGGDNIIVTRGTDGKITISADNTAASIQVGNIMAQESAAGGWAFVPV